MFQQSQTEAGNTKTKEKKHPCLTEQRLTIELLDQWRTDSLYQVQYYVNMDSCNIDLYYYLFPFPIIAILIYYSVDWRKKAISQKYE